MVNTTIPPLILFYQCQNVAGMTSGAKGVVSREDWVEVEKKEASTPIRMAARKSCDPGESQGPTILIIIVGSKVVGALRRPQNR